MSSYLWKYYFEDDVEKFRQLLASATFNTSVSGSKNGPGGRGSNTGPIGSPGTSLSTSPSLTAKVRKPQGGHSSNVTLSRADLNWKDSNGITLLHYVASSSRRSACEFALALLQVPLVDPFIQDAESGWTALHRALYFGNVTIARMLMDRDAQDSGHGHLGTHNNVGGLIKIKDHEGNSPFDVYGASITSRSIRPGNNIPLLSSSSDDDENENAQGISGDNDDVSSSGNVVAPRTKLDGHEIFAFGSNKNLTLGFGDEDDRQFPERISLKRPEHLLRRLNAEHQASQSSEPQSQVPSSLKTLSSLPALVQYRPIVIQDVQLSKLHSAILTTDPESNLYICGFGKGGRLGTGDEATRFHYVPICGGGLAGKKITHVALGQNHSLAISSEGEVYAWGSNAYGQLGYATASSNFRDEEPIQLLPRQVFGSLKRELVVGAAASGIHSVIHTSLSLYTFGKNVGQLGLVDSDARSLATQGTPRKVAASLFTSSIHAVSAIDKATVCLLENHDVWVLANYGYTKLVFPAEGFSNYFLKSVFASTRQTKTQSEICKITSGGDTICAMSSSGDVFTVHVSQNAEVGATSTSTTNPAKITRALSPPQRVWSMEKGHIAVTDVDVGQDGSIVICTDSGSVWRRVKRTKIKDTSAPSSTGYKSKDYKFSRVPGLTKINAVRSNAFGAYAAVRKDCDVLQTQIGVDSSSLWRDIYPLLPLQGLSIKEDPETENPAPRFWLPAPPNNDTATIRRAILQARDIEGSLSSILPDLGLSISYDLRIGTTLSEVLFPVHEFILAGRSGFLRGALSEFRRTYFFSVPEIMHIEYDSEGKILVQFQGIDILAVLNLVLYVYTDTVVDVWHHTRHAPGLASRYRQVRSELMRIASSLELRKLEHAVRLMVEPPKTLHTDLGLAIRDLEYFENGEIEVELDGLNMKVHQALVCQRCPFFEGLFNGRAAGVWLSTRREDVQDPVKVDLKHVQPGIFRIVLQHIYADTDENLFNDVVTDSFDAFLDLIMDVMSVANELMLDRLAQCCQKMLGRFVNTRNVCQLLNAVAPCSVTEFKNAALEYICLNLEGLLENHLLDELDEDLILELDETVRQNQVTSLPFSKSGRAESELFERYPGLVDIIERGRRAKVDSFRLQSRLREEGNYHASTGRARPVSRSDQDDTPSRRKATPIATMSEVASGRSLEQKSSTLDLMFEMDEEKEDRVSLTPAEPTATSNEPNLNLLFSTSQGHNPSLTSAETGRSMNLTASFDTSTSPAHGSSSMTNDFSISPKIPAIGTKAWGASALNLSKLDMKEIMAQASSHRASNLSSGLVQHTLGSGSASSSQTTKLSQKERKRQQQQQQLRQEIAPFTPDPTQEEEPTPTPKPSPWRIASSGQKVSLKDVLGAESSTSSPVPTEKLCHRASNPPLTMRQTIPGNAVGLRRATSGGLQQDATPPPTRSISTPAVSQKPISAQSPSTTKNTASPAIQSIRYTPAPVEPSLQLSMTDILTQQQTEKDVIREAVAKRSLQEIQEEQAFQEWWDQESKKVREEEEQEARGKTGGPARGRSGRSRGKGLPSRRPPPQIPRRGLPTKRRIPNVQKVVAVSSAKGGVGKSTIAVNLALQFARNGLRSGILDTDIFGPSIPTIMGLLDVGEPRLTAQNHLIPLSNYGVKSMSMGYLVRQDAPVAWRGMMVVKALQQLLHEVDWGGLDMLVLDLPPGTGDTQLTIAQQVELDGVVIVSTPQDVALKDTLKGISMFQKMNINILGMVQNMSTFICPQCSHQTSIFGSTGAKKACEEHGLHFLGDIPLHESICEDADRGKPTVVAEPGSRNAEAFDGVAKGVISRLGILL